MLPTTTFHFLVKKFLLCFHGEPFWLKPQQQISSKGQIVIPDNVRKAANLKKGERILAVAIGDTVILKKIVDKSFQESLKPVWDKAKQMGLTEEDLNAIVEDARA